MGVGVVRDRDNHFISHQDFKKGITVEEGATLDEASIETLSVGTLVQTITEETTDFTAVEGNEYGVDTSAAAVSVKFPLSPSVGGKMVFHDVAWSWDIHNVSIDRNGQKINGVAADETLSLAGSTAIAIYRGTSYGWFLKVV
jgi:hypothetical protein